jgi:hypothetical protein
MRKLSNITTNEKERWNFYVGEWWTKGRLVPYLLGQWSHIAIPEGGSKID